MKALRFQSGEIVGHGVETFRVPSPGFILWIHDTVFQLIHKAGSLPSCPGIFGIVCVSLYIYIHLYSLDIYIYMCVDTCLSMNQSLYMYIFRYTCNYSV